MKIVTVVCVIFSALSRQRVQQVADHKHLSAQDFDDDDQDLACSDDSLAPAAAASVRQSLGHVHAPASARVSGGARVPRSPALVADQVEEVDESEDLFVSLLSRLALSPSAVPGEVLHALRDLHTRICFVEDALESLHAAGVLQLEDMDTTRARTSTSRTTRGGHSV